MESQKLIFNHLKNVNHKKLLKPVLTIGNDIAEEDQKLIFNHLKNVFFIIFSNVNHKKLVKPVLTIGYDIAEEPQKINFQPPKKCQP